MDALANPVRPDEVNVTVQPTDLLPVVIGDARHPYVDKTFFQPQFVHRTYADVLMPELRVGTEHSAISRSSVQTAIRERELTAIESGLDQDHNRARIHEVLDGSFGVLDPAFRFPFGFNERDVITTNDNPHVPALRQRPIKEEDNA